MSRKARPGRWSSDATVDAHAISMMTACVSLLAGRVRGGRGRDHAGARCPHRRMGRRDISSTVSGIAAFALAAQDRSDEAEVYVDEARALGADDDVSDAIPTGERQSESPRRARETTTRRATWRRRASRSLDRRRLLDMAILCVNTADVHRAAGRSGRGEKASRAGDRGCATSKGIVLGADWMQEQLAAL